MNDGEGLAAQAGGKHGGRADGDEIRDGPGDRETRIDRNDLDIGGQVYPLAHGGAEALPKCGPLRLQKPFIQGGVFLVELAAGDLEQLDEVEDRSHAQRK